MTRDKFIKLFGECPFEMVRQGYRFTDPEILKLTFTNHFKRAFNGGFNYHNYHWTVAHSMAFRGHKFTDPDILKLADENGWTVAHVMARRGYNFNDPEIRKLASNNGWTVANEIWLITNHKK